MLGKRPYEPSSDNLDQSERSKRLHSDFVKLREGEIMIKLLSPVVALGAVIGKGGTVLQQITKENNVLIKVSQANQFYPGTQDRVISISGMKDSVFGAVRDIIYRVFESLRKKQLLPPSIYTSASNSTTVDSDRRDYEFSCLIPNTSSGSLIGKGGSIIREIGERTHSKVKLGDSNDHFGTKERILYLRSSSMDNVVRGVLSCFEQALTEPHLFVYTNTSVLYDNYVAPVTSYVPQDSGDSYPQADESYLPAYIPPNYTEQRHSHNGFTSHDTLPNDSQHASSHLSYDNKFDTRPPYDNRQFEEHRPPNRAPTQFVQPPPAQVQQSYDYSHTSHQPNFDVRSPTHDASYSNGAQSSYASQQYNPPPPRPVPSQQTYSQNQSYSQHPYTSTNPQPPSQISTQSPTQVPGLPPGVTAPQFSTDGTKIIMQMGIPDNLLGSVIGPGGSILKEIIESSGSFAYVSAKGENLPGTAMRYLKVSGSQPQVQAALDNVLGRLQNASRAGTRR